MTSLWVSFEPIIGVKLFDLHAALSLPLATHLVVTCSSFDKAHKLGILALLDAASWFGKAVGSGGCSKAGFGTKIHRHMTPSQRLGLLNILNASIQAGAVNNRGVATVLLD